MLPQHLKQIRVLMLNEKENLERMLFRLEQGNSSFVHKSNMFSSNSTYFMYRFKERTIFKENQY